MAKAWEKKFEEEQKKYAELQKKYNDFKKDLSMRLEGKKELSDGMKKKTPGWINLFYNNY